MSEKIRLGVAPNPNTTVGLAYQFSGYIDELFIYNRALSVEEILMLYQASLWFFKDIRNSDPNR